MADTTFTDKQTGITADWANDVNDTVYGLRDSTDVAKGDALILGKRTDTGAVEFTLHEYNENRPINVKTDFGAVGDGVTDDSTAIQAAITFAMSIYGNCEIVVPAGSYRIGTRLIADIADITLTSNSTGSFAAARGFILRGSGQDVTKFIADQDNSDGILKVVSRSNHDIIKISDISFISLLRQDIYDHSAAEIAAGTFDYNKSNGIALFVRSIYGPTGGSALEIGDEYVGGWSTNPVDMVQIENVIVHGDAFNHGAAFRAGIFTYGIVCENIWQPRIINCRVHGGHLNYAGTDYSGAVLNGNWYKSAIYLKHTYLPHVESPHVSHYWDNGVWIRDDADPQGVHSIEDGGVFNADIGAAPYCKNAIYVDHPNADNVQPLGGGSVFYEPAFTIISPRIKASHHGIRIRGRRQVIVNSGRFYMIKAGEVSTPTELEESHPSGVFLERASDCIITACQFHESGLYVSDSYSCCGIRIDGTHARGIYIQGNNFKMRGIGILNNGTDVDVIAPNDGSTVPGQKAIICIFNHFNGAGVHEPTHRYLDNTGFMSWIDYDLNTDRTAHELNIVGVEDGDYSPGINVKNLRPDYATTTSDVPVSRTKSILRATNGNEYSASEILTIAVDSTAAALHSRLIFRLPNADGSYQETLRLDSVQGQATTPSGYRVGASQVVGARATGWTAGTGTANKAAFATYAGQTVSAGYVQAEAQATDDAAKANSQRIKAIEDALRTHGLIN